MKRRNVNDYYFSEIGITTDHEGSIVECRERGFGLLESQPDFLENTVLEVMMKNGHYGKC